ncbi:MAG: TIGR03617 family F420-dependent LLM class oxidoreductase [Minwuia sp.]|uniref:TIGR03617 family F420-dependent LLM class oxidoreductase n=1 Tax=Minwuia sp. TaxID=2493630 RepID=UPI003A8A2D35
MKIDRTVRTDLDKVPGEVREAEALGHDGIATAELANDPFLALVLAAEHSEKVELATAIAVAFARSPMTLAIQAHDLNAYSKGRFILGLGSQIKPHITKRFSMPWSAPAARMKELIQAVQAIWACWYDGARLDFHGEHYTHTLMTPMFTPDNTQYGKPKIFLAAVGPKMTETAAEVADGLLVHAFTTPSYFREVTVPTVKKTMEAAGRKRADFEFSLPVMAAIATNDQELEKARFSLKKRISFYGSTPNYKPVLDHHGWGDLQPELNMMSKQGLWDEMAHKIPDEVLDTFGIAGTPAQVTDWVIENFGGELDRVTVDVTANGPDEAKELMAKLRAA